jgi:hypothetical protein
MAAKIVFALGVMGIGGYVWYTVAQYDPSAFPYSKAAVQDILMSAETTIPSNEKLGGLRIWGAAKTAEGVDMEMRYSSSASAPVIPCKAVITEIGPEKSRVVADCNITGPDSAMFRNRQEMQAPFFEEHILSKLGHQDFDSNRVAGKATATLMVNMPGMQREALKVSDEMTSLSARSRIDNARSAASAPADE